MPAFEKGYTQVYTGNGKGKTTASFGLALRAAGAEIPVFIGQFMKGRTYSEITAFQRFDDLITLEQFGEPHFIKGQPSEKDLSRARAGFERLKAVVLAGEHPVVIAEEANNATHFGLLPVDDFLELIAQKPNHVELILTGRNADPRIIEAADLVTEMKEIKHYYQQGIPARTGIEK